MEKNQMSGSTYNILFLVNLLIEKKQTIKTILQEFKNKNISLTRTSINNYINILIKNKIDIDIQKEGKENTYSINIENKPISYSIKSIDCIQDLKKILVSKKDFFLIKNAVYIFYKISKDFNIDLQSLVANFGYFSSLNWHVTSNLEKHCFDKDEILIEYMLPDGKSKDIIIHADKLLFRQNSNRLYLFGTLKNSIQFSYLPVDRIFAIKKITRERKCFNIPTKLLSYTVLKKNFKLSNLDANETITKENSKYLTITRPITDEFSIVQKLLNLCPDLVYISDENIKNLVIDKLKALEVIYEK